MSIKKYNVAKERNLVYILLVLLLTAFFNDIYSLENVQEFPHGFRIFHSKTKHPLICLTICIWSLCILKNGLFFKCTKLPDRKAPSKNERGYWCCPKGEFGKRFGLVLLKVTKCYEKSSFWHVDAYLVFKGWPWLCRCSVIIAWVVLLIIPCLSLT